MKCMGGEIQGRLWPRDDDERAAAVAAGYDLDRVLAHRRPRQRRQRLLLRSPASPTARCSRASTTTRAGRRTQSLVMRSRSGHRAPGQRPPPPPEAPRLLRHRLRVDAAHAPLRGSDAAAPRRARRRPVGPAAAPAAAPGRRPRPARRRRLGDAEPVRGGSVQDVITHLVGTNQFWTASIASGLAGTPTRYLAVVRSGRHTGADGRRAAPPVALGRPRRVRRHQRRHRRCPHRVDEAAWSSLAEAPPGHIAVNLVVLHALWDSWIHERDVLLPLGVDPVEEPDEVTGCLTYASAIGLGAPWPRVARAGGHAGHRRHRPRRPPRRRGRRNGGDPRGRPDPRRAARLRGGPSISSRR